MKTKRAFRYVGTPDPMSDKEAYHCEKYIKKNKHSLVRAGQYLVDITALSALFHLDCWNCRTVHRETCCEGGQPYAVEEWQIPILEGEIPSISAGLQDESERNHWLLHGVWDRNEPPGTIRMRHGNCLFYQEKDGRYGCAIHAYAEQAGREVEPLKPFSCQLYPIDLIDTEEGILLTAVTNETSSFSRWGTDYLEQFYCASPARRKLATHIDDKLFALDGYRPAYEWNLPLLRYILQDDAERIEGILASSYQLER
ncbi:DUF3109 family protein [Brevibacillus formosus]|uniref:DUF3109 domain-containing protein n=1 Tax=Brevibacillus formosus TaxID=54913 RepID=A0A837KPG6_9BACL|nr:DUF3109 family protein [Brevibacillus formosus]KLH99548.1 hypothetical protein AA984_05260 [Brevibacillus formosus]MED1959911.1 DUF3109 family protein [Brevibacillus formosus]PSJ95597.1 DUF3109 domain-containing protein [Brevibacillus formosus]GED55929.1 hypothetical protein BFO01nite_00610 [Brevibacillus formosus]